MEIATGQDPVEFNEYLPVVKGSLVPSLLSNDTSKVPSPKFRAAIIPVNEGSPSALELQNSRGSSFLSEQCSWG